MAPNICFNRKCGLIQFLLEVGHQLFNLLADAFYSDKGPQLQNTGLHLFFFFFCNFHTAPTGVLQMHPTKSSTKQKITQS